MNEENQGNNFHLRVLAEKYSKKVLVYDNEGVVKYVINEHLDGNPVKLIYESSNCRHWSSVRPDDMKSSKINCLFDAFISELGSEKPV